MLKFAVRRGCSFVALSSFSCWGAEGLQDPVGVSALGKDTARSGPGSAGSLAVAFLCLLPWQK